MMHDTELDDRRQDVSIGGAAFRRFTGVLGVEPSPATPEHLAYFEYEIQLQQAIAQLQQKRERDEKRYMGLAAEAEGARQHAAAELRAKQADRDARPTMIHSALNWVDRNLPQRRSNEALRRAADIRDTTAHQLEILEAERTAVQHWIAQMFVDVDKARSAREMRAAAAELDRAAGARDISPRWCQVMSSTQYLAGDPRRIARAWEGDNVVAGVDYGYGWRHDGTDRSGGAGTWSLHWNEENHETILELRDPEIIWLLGTAISSRQEADLVLETVEPLQRERNSIALVLDSYAAHRAAMKTP